MISKSRLFVSAFIASIVVLSAVASPAGTITYMANSDPTAAAYDGYVTETGIQPFTWMGPLPNDDYAGMDGDTPIWVVVDSAAGGDPDYTYHMTPTSADKTLAASKGWNLTVNMKLSGSVDAFSYIARYWDGYEKEAWCMQFKNEAGGTSAPVVAINYHNTTVGYVFDAPSTGYHSYQLAYDPASPGVVDFLIDGNIVANDLEPLHYANAYDDVAFGDNSSDTAYAGQGWFREVTWQVVPEPSALALTICGLFSLATFVLRKANN